MEERISTNFTLHEFEESDKAKELHVDNTIPRGSSVEASIRELVKTVLQPLRTAWGMPMTVNSGYRVPAVNKAVGGKWNSQHLIGEAADIHVKNSAEAYNLASLAKALNLPYDQIGLGDSLVHISHKLRGAQRRMFFYYPQYRGAKMP